MDINLMPSILLRTRNYIHRFMSFQKSFPDNFLKRDLFMNSQKLPRSLF